MITQNLSTLKIHKLTQEQYDRELAAGRIDENALYLTPDEEIDLTPYATKEEVATKADAEHSHEISDVTDLQSTLDSVTDELKDYTDTVASSKADSSHTHSISEVTNLQSTLDSKVPVSRTVNGKALNSNITLTASDVGAASESEVDEAIGQINSDIDEINDTLAEHTVSIEEMSADIATNASAIERLTNGVSAEEVDGVNDLIQYVNEHGAEVTGIRADIQANTDAIGATNAKMPVHIRFVTENGALVLADSTYAEIDALVVAGVPVCLVHDYNGEQRTYHFNNRTTDGTLYFYWHNNLYFNKLTLKSDGTLTEQWWSLVTTANNIGRSGTGSYAEIFNSYAYNKASGQYSHAEGKNTTASGQYSHAEGESTTASQSFTHSEGQGTIASNHASHAEGYWTVASGQFGSHSEGRFTIASGHSGAHAEGYGTISRYAITGDANATTYQINEDTVNNYDFKFIYYSGKIYNITSYNATNKTVSVDTTLSNTALSAVKVHFIKDGIASGLASHAEGYGTIASGEYGSHAEGRNTTASGDGSHVEGYKTIASGAYSHAEGRESKASADYSHAEGTYSQATGLHAHAEGFYALAQGNVAHAEGYYSAANGRYSHAEGCSTIADSESQHTQGKYNIADSNNIYAHIVGNGDSSTARSNAHTLDWSGNAWYAGDIKIGGSSYDDAEAKTVSTTDHRHSWNELKNRPFYDSDNCTVGSYLGGYIQAGSNGIKTARLYDVDLTMLESGATYHITFLEQDSPYAEIASYDWVVKEWDSTSNDPYYVGNPIIYADSGSLGEDSGEPAVLYTRDGAAYMAIDTRREPLTVITGLLNVVISKEAGLKTLDEKYIPDTIARISDLAQSDWSINDPSNPAYIHNRPFYTTDPTNITLLSGTYSFRQTGDALYAAQLDTMSQVVAEGQTLSVTYNGSVHDAVVKTATIDSVTYLCAGNVSILNSMFGTSFENTNEPFVLIFANTASVLYTSAAPSNTNVAINTVTSEIITIPHEYLGLNVDNGAGDYAVVEGFNTTADGQYAHAEGAFTEASGLAAHAEGSSTRATGVTAHAEGTGSVASGDYSHAEGNTTQATKAYAHSEGYYTEATGEYGAHAEGYFAVASGDTSHAEGSHTQATGSHSHAEGFRTIAAGEYQHVEGQYNIEDTESKYIHIAGNGSKDGPVRSNAHTLDWDGNAWFAGDVYIGSTSGTDKDGGSKKLASEEYVGNAIAAAIGNVIGGSY